MKPIDQALQTLIQREPTPDEIAKFYRIKDTCGFSDHDSVWSLLLAFGHYEILYGEIPQKITEQARQLLADHKIALEAAAEAAERAVRASLIEQVSKTAREMADRAVEAGKILASADSRRKFAFAILAALAISIPATALLAYGAYSAGARSAANEAVADAVWARSPEGRAARSLAKLNNVQAMLECPTYQVRKEGNSTYCVPFDERTNRSFGWRIK
ncbi:hypothetical protein FX016_23005 [Cupriavidus gilardii]|nr:hypothetical protein FX016_23005 [Cupriavidus gilardii]